MTDRKPSIHTRWISPGEDLSDAYSIRAKVFIEEQNVPPELEMDDIDPVTDHVVLYKEDKPVATGRIVREPPIITLGRIAVLPECRGSGFGAQVVELLTAKAFEEGAEEVHLHAQTHALAFYEKLGFTPYGEPYEEAGIPHISMKKRKPGKEQYRGRPS